MPRKLTTGIKAVERKNPDGSLRRVDYYDRASGAHLGHDREQAIAKALAGRGKPAPPPANTFAGLVTAYLASPDFRDLGAKTKTLNRGYADQLRERFGDLPSASITRQVVRTLRDAYANQPTKGNRLVSTLRLLLGYGVQIGKLKENAASKPGRLKESPRRQIWSEGQIERFIMAAPPTLKRAAALLFYTAQRPSDVLAMTTAALAKRDGRVWIALRQQKTDELIEVPLHRRAVEIMGKPTGTLLVPAPRGGTWAYRNFARAWDLAAHRADHRLAREVIAGWPARSQRRPDDTERLKAELRSQFIRGGVQRRDFRRTGMVKMAEAGATPSQIAAVSGHTIDQTTRILDTYIPRRGSVARGAIEAWEAGANRGQVVQFGKRHSVVTPNDTAGRGKARKSLK